MERYRRFLPVSDATPPLTLGEGFTPLVRADAARRGARPARPAPQGRGPEPDRLVQGSRDGARGRQGRRGRRAGDRLRLDRQHVGLGRGVRRGRRASRSSSSCRRARSRSASCSRRLMAGARVVAIDGNFDQALNIVRALAEQDDHPVTLVNSVNPFRLEGQKTAAFEICDDLGPRPGHPGDPGRQCRQHQRLLGGFPRLRGGRARRLDAADVGLPGRRRRAAGRRPPDRPTRRPSRPRSGSATPRRGPRRSRHVTSRADGSAPSPTRRSWPRTGRSRGSRASSASRRRRRASPASEGRRGRRGRPRCDRRVRPDRPRAQGPDDRRAPGPAVPRGPADRRRGRRGARLVGRKMAGHWLAERDGSGVDGRGARLGGQPRGRLRLPRPGAGADQPDRARGPRSGAAARSS